MLTAVYTVPVDVNGRPLLAESESPDKSGLGARDQVGQTDKPSHESSAGRAEGNRVMSPEVIGTDQLMSQGTVKCLEFPKELPLSTMIGMKGLLMNS